MQPGEVLFLFDRSSNPRKKGLVLINSVGVIDGDYYNNPSNEGHIFAQMKNITDKAITLPYGERIVQGVFMNHLIVDNDVASGDRTGGFGSTDKGWPMKQLPVNIIFAILFAFIVALVVTIWQTSDENGRLIFLLAISPITFGVFGVMLNRILY